MKTILHPASTSPITSTITQGITPSFNIAHSTTGQESLTIGRYFTTNWRSEGFVGTSYREWIGDVDYFRFIFTQLKGGQIGSIGKTRFSTNYDWGGVRIDDLPSIQMMSTNATMENLVGVDYYYGIYGWTHEQDITWVGNGWNNEFYIVFQGRTINNNNNFTYIGTVVVDEVTFDCYKLPHPSWMASSQTQWIAESRDRVWSPSVNIVPILHHFRENGMSNEYIMSLSWIIEVLGGGVSGNLYMDHILVPDL